MNEGCSWYMGAMRDFYFFHKLRKNLMYYKRGITQIEDKCGL